MSAFGLPVRRPVATSMFFLGVFLLGAIAWQRIPVELLPPVAGDELFLSFSRPGSEPEVIEREILLPLEARVGEFAGVEESWAEIRGSGGSLRVRFESGTDLEARELDLRRVAAELAREQPRGTSIDVGSQDLTSISRFVMFVQVTGLSDRGRLLDFVEDRISPRLAAVPGTARVMAGGGGSRELTVKVDSDRCAALGVSPDQVTSALARSVQRLRYLGGTEDEAGRTAVILDGRPQGVQSLSDLRITPDRPVLLRHVADVSLGNADEEILFRVNGQNTVAMIVFQEEGANLVRLGRQLRERLDELEAEFGELGIGFVVNFDASQLVQDQLERLQGLALGGFVIALVVLYLFLRHWRAVGVVAIAVPASLLAALALLFLAGQSINLITLFGLAVGIGMLVDNSIVVYEAVQRQLEHGSSPDEAAETGVRRTVRAILAATTTNAIVFLPVILADLETVTRELLKVMALAILLPMIASVLVAVGLVPLLARRMAAPAALSRIAQLRERRRGMGGFSPPDRIRDLFGGILTVALRQPAGWLTGVVAAVLLTVVIALPWVAVGTASQEPPEAETVRFSVELDGSESLESAAAKFDRLELAVGDLEGIRFVESVVREDGGSLTVHLLAKGERPGDVNASKIRQVIRDEARELDGIDLDSTDSFGGGGGGSGGGGGIAALLGQGPARVVVSGPDAGALNLLGRDVSEQLESLPEIASANVSGSRDQPELRVIPDERALETFGLTGDQVLPAIRILRREGVPFRIGFTLADGREIPMTVRRADEARRPGDDLRELRLATPVGSLPLGVVAQIRKMPPQETVVHHNGRRELSIRYRFDNDAPKTGPARQALEDELRVALSQVRRPPGYTIESPEADESFSWFKRILIPVVLLLYAVLAVTFESLTLPLLVLVALPLTVLGATWALVLADMPADMMALVGVIALIGLTINPAILLVDRMQQRAWHGGRTAGAAALAAVRERARPVLMTTATTVCGLWPLALVTGTDNEIWPPFATVVMGGLVTSTALTLLVVPVGFVFLHRLDRVFGRLGPWIVLAWIGATAAVIAPLVVTETIDSMTWQILTTLLVAAMFLGVAVWIFRRPEMPEPQQDSGPPAVEVRFLHKVYGRPGPVGRAWRAPQRFAQKVLALGSRAFDTRDALARIVPLALVLGGALFLALELNTIFWRICWTFAAATLAAGLLREIRRARGRADAVGRVDPGGVEGAAAAMMPWVAFAFVATRFWAEPRLAGDARPMNWIVVTLLALVVLVVQSGRHTAVRLARGDIAVVPATRRLRRIRGSWRRFCRAWFGLDLPREEVHALRGAHFRATQGMVGVLGPNGAGKTTLLRLLAGILDPSLGTARIGEVPIPALRRQLARWVGYLPQDFGLPRDLTARQYLEYFGLLYEIKPAERRRERVQKLLEDVGLAERADEPIGGYSGGMRQRVAVARTLLRLPAVIIVDEPTVGLDPRERIRFRNLLARLAEGRVVLFSTHVVEDVEVACERVLVLARGQIVFDGPPADLAAVAEGRAWTVVSDELDDAELPAGAMVVDQVPVGVGRIRRRILAEAPPAPEAEAEPPTLEDGYLWLVGERVPA